MTTRTTSEIFAPAIANAERLSFMHRRIQVEPSKEWAKAIITAAFHAGRINGCDREMLLDLYVSEA